MKELMRILVVIVCVAGLSACNNGGNKAITQSDSEEKKEWIIGLDDTFAPMGFRNENNELVGFDVELAGAIAEAQGWKLKFQPIDWAMKEKELQSKNIDMIWNGYTITPERKEKVAFSQPYLANRQIVIVMSASSVQTLADLAGKSVALQAESSALTAVRNKQGFAESLKEIPEYATNTEVFRDLEVGRADAIVVDEVLARYYMKTKGEDAYRILQENLGEEEFGVGVRKEDTELLTALNNGMKIVKENGKYDEIYKKWFSDN